MKFSKVRKTDYRPPSARQNPPLERDARPGAAAWDGMNASARIEAAKHDVMVAGMSRTILTAMAKDLGSRRCWNLKDPEHRWTMGRRAAVGRALSKVSPASA